MAFIDTIGTRAYSECLKLWGGSIYRAAKALEVSSPVIVYRWGSGEACPSAHFLAKLYHAGADIKYILVGER